MVQTSQSKFWQKDDPLAIEALCLSTPKHNGKYGTEYRYLTLLFVLLRLLGSSIICTAAKLYPTICCQMRKSKMVVTFISYYKGCTAGTSMYPLFIYSKLPSYTWFDLIWFIVFNATFSNISAIYMATTFHGGRSRSTRGEPPTMGKQLVSFITCAASRVHPFYNLQSRARTHVVLVIGLYELFDNPTT